MALTDDERKMLEQLEAQLVNEDPSFARVLANDDDVSAGAPGFSVSAKNLVLGLIIAVIGLIVVVAAVAMEIVPVGIAGAVVVFLGFWYLVSGKEQRVENAGVRAKKPPQSRPSFMDRQAQEWQKRRDSRGF